MSEFSATFVRPIARRARWGVAIAVVLTFAGLHAARADDQDAISYRQLIMKEMDAETTILGMMLSGQIPPDNISQQTKALAASIKSALKAFEPKVPGGNAKPEVWTKWDDFSKRLQAMSQAADALAKAGEANNVTTITELVEPATQCKQCHDVYRTPLKK